jgi:hypothetical protein
LSGCGTGADDTDIVFAFSVDNGEKTVLVRVSDREEAQLSNRMKGIVEYQGARIIQNAGGFDEGHSMLEEVCFGFFSIPFDHDLEFDGNWSDYNEDDRN